MGFKFSPIKKIEFPIVDENDVPIKAYTLDVGSDSFVRAMLDKGALVVRIARDFTNNPSAYDDLVGAIRDFIGYSLGAGEYDFLFEKFGKNIFAMIELVRAITAEGNKALSERVKQSSALYE